ncbi:glutathione S-transferase, nitrogen catabolite repression regulator [Aspergillus niger]|nr:glutathione S-transferase, nitrogen catabolite repression regulator [Aspergillus niger]GLA00445.1 glutathione S-transferase, nitrogen catabolite repression regulator [Aspergillus niger]
MTNLKPITVWLTPSGPNPWKVIVILEELNIPYKINAFGFEDVKKPPFISINPNGRVPAIQDPNTPNPTNPNHPFTLWESGAIIQYLIDLYDPTHILSYPPSTPEKHLLNQYLQFQMSGQGPYYGQCGWFSVLSPQKLPVAITRYQAEVHRILSVLNTILEGRTWLVGEKCTYADLAFLPWNCQLEMLIPKDSEDEGGILDPYPWVKAWHERMEGRESWKRAMVLREKLMGEQGLGRNGMPEGVSDIGEYEEFIRRKEEEEGGERIDEEEGVLGCVGVRSISGYQEGQGKQGEKDGEEEERWDEQTGVLGCVGVRSIGENQEKEARQEDGNGKEEERWDEDTGVLGCIGVGNLGGYREKQQGQGERTDKEQEDRWDEDTGVLGCSKIGH